MLELYFVQELIARNDKGDEKCKLMGPFNTFDLASMAAGKMKMQNLAGEFTAVTFRRVDDVAGAAGRASEDQLPAVLDTPRAEGAEDVGATTVADSPAFVDEEAPRSGEDGFRGKVQL